MRHMLLGAYVLACLACLIWPVYGAVGTRIEPFIFGLPLSFAWVVGWCLLTFVVMCAYHVADERAAESDASPAAGSEDRSRAGQSRGAVGES